MTATGEFWTVNLTQSTLEAVEYILTGKNSFAVEAVAAQDTKTTSKENPNQQVRGIGQGKANISVPTDEDSETQRKEALITKARKLKFPRTVLLESLQNEWCKLCTI